MKMENEILNQTTREQLVQHINEAALFTDTSFVITACNKIAANLFHFKQPDVLGLTLSSLVSTSSLTNVHKNSKNAACKGFSELISPVGKKIPVHTTRLPIAPSSADGGYLFIYKPVDAGHLTIETSNAGLPYGTAGTCLYDEEPFNWPDEPTGEAVLIFNRSFQCLDANTNACRLTGYSRHELTQLSLQHLLHADELHQSLPEASPEKIFMEKKMRAKDGSTWYAEFMLQQLFDDQLLSFVHDITKRKKTELALLEANREFDKTTAQLRELSDHLLDIRETERKNIAREIHDELGQQLTILKMDVSWLRQKLQKYDDAAVLKKTGDTLQLLNETIKTVRRIATELRPSMLDDLGLIEAIEWQSKEFEKRAGIRISFECGIPHLPVSGSIATSLFRIYQEALTNIARHAKAKHVFSNMQLANDQVILTIKDDGIGFDPQTLGVKKTLGLLGMKERTLMMGGRFEINSKAGEGTTIVITTSLQSDELRSQADQ
jgi:PAS domain S-box-containing protein